MDPSAGGDAALETVRLMTVALEGLDRGTGARASLCAAVAGEFGCRSCAHAWRGPPMAVWSLCLWRETIREGTRETSTVTLSVREDELDAPGGRLWASGPTRTMVVGWLAAPYLAEIPLRSEADCVSLLVLGRDAAFGNEDARRLNDLRRPLRAVENAVIRLEPPAPVSSLSGQDLTERELQVLAMLSEGSLARSIAHRLAVSERTVHKHLGNVYRKLDVHDRLLAVRKAEELGLLVSTARGDPVSAVV